MTRENHVDGPVDDNGTDYPFRTGRIGRMLPVFFQAPAEPRPSAPIRADDVTPRRFTLRVLFASKRFTLTAGLLLALSMVGEALVPVIVGAAIDGAITSGDFSALLGWLAILALDVLVLSLAFRFGSRLGLFGMQRVQHRLRMQVVDVLLDPRGDTGLRSDGASLSIATSDVSRLAAVMQLSVYPAGEIAGVLFAAIALGALSWQLGAAAVAGSVLLIVLMFVSGRSLRNRAEQQQALAADAVDRAADLVAGYRVIKGFRSESEAGARYRSTSRAALRGTLAAKRAEGWFLGGLESAAGVFTAAVAVLAGVLAVDGRLTVGELITAVGLLQFIISPVTALPANVGAVWARSVASSARVLSVLRTAIAEDRSPSAQSRLGAAGRVGPTDAPKSSTPSDYEVLTVELAGVSLRLEPGEVVGLDAGQSVAADIARLLSGADRAGSRGTTSLGGSSPHDLGVESWRARVVVAPRRPELFDGSIEWNVRTPGGDGSLVGPALHAAACDDIIASLVGGRAARVGENGHALSGGQRQRVALARAYAADAPVLVLHDPTTSVDSVTEQLVADRLPEIRAGRTTLVLTSSEALLARCDRVVRIRRETECS